MAAKMTIKFGKITATESALFHPQQDAESKTHNFIFVLLEVCLKNSTDVRYN
jgi:hypothetical protein